MDAITLRGSGITKEFNRRVVFERMHFTLSSPGSLSITGRNGAGKSTLIRIIAGTLLPTAGRVEWNVDGSPVGHERRRRLIGFVSPYLNLYEEFTALENLILLSRIRGTKATADECKAALDSVGLRREQNDPVRTFSSGMKQRAKYAFALLHNPGVLLLDEPTANLDGEAIRFVRKVVLQQKRTGILIVASNDAREAAWCENSIALGER